MSTITVPQQGTIIYKYTAEEEFLEIPVEKVKILSDKVRYTGQDGFVFEADTETPDDITANVASFDQTEAQTTFLRKKREKLLQTIENLQDNLAARQQELETLETEYPQSIP